MNTIKPIPPFKGWVIQNFPFIEADFDAITNYQLYCKIVEYLNKVIANENELTTAMNYVLNYFNNLDVQDEIDNKLDEMAESGQLAEIIAQYIQLNGVLAYDTLNDLINAENVVNGSICKTLGNITYNDGKGAYYKVRTVTSGDVVDGINIVALDVSDTLIAERIEDPFIDIKSNPIYYGADPTGELDSSIAINNCILANKGKSINFTTGTYLINNTINLPFKNNEKVSINGNGSKLIVNQNLTNLFFYGYDRNENEINDVGFSSYIKDLFIDCSNVNVENAFYNEDGFKDLKIYNITIYRAINGVKLGTNGNIPCDVLIENCMIYGKGSEYSGYGVICNLSDYNINMCRIYGFREGFLFNNGGLVDKCHVLLRWKNQTTSNFDPYERNSSEFNEYYEQTKFGTVNNTVRISNCYCDSTYQFLYIDTSHAVDVVNCQYLNARSNVNCELFNIIRGDSKVNITNSLFYLCSNNYCSVIKLSASDGLNKYSMCNFKNNIVRYTEHLTEMFDPIISNIPSFHDSINVASETWYIIGGIANSDKNQRFSLLVFINGYMYNIHMQLDSNGNPTAIYQINKGSGTNNWTLGALKVGNGIYLCVKNTGNANYTELNFEIIESYKQVFKTIPINTGFPNNSSRLLSDYTASTPTITTNLNNIQV